MIKLFGIYSTNEEVIVRLTYTLGNIVAKIDNTRVKVSPEMCFWFLYKLMFQFYNEEGSIESLLDLWAKYLERTLQTRSLMVDNDDSESNPEDVMIKVKFWHVISFLIKNNFC